MDVHAIHWADKPSADKHNGSFKGHPAGQNLKAGKAWFIPHAPMCFKVVKVDQPRSTHVTLDPLRWHLVHLSLYCSGFADPTSTSS